MTDAPLTQHWRTDPEGGGGSSQSGFQGTRPPLAIIAKSKNFAALQHGVARIFKSAPQRHAAITLQS